MKYQEGLKLVLFFGAFSCSQTASENGTVSEARGNLSETAGTGSWNLLKTPQPEVYLQLLEGAPQHIAKSPEDLEAISSRRSTFSAGALIAGIHTTWLPDEPFGELIEDPFGRLETPEQARVKLQVDPNVPRFVVRAPRPATLTLSAPIGDSDLVDQARSFVSLIGLNPAETTFQVRNLMLQEQTIGQPGVRPAVATVIGRKVVVSRQLGGIPVLGDRLVISFDATGEFQKAMGRWGRVDYSLSLITTTLSDEAIIKAAASALAERGIALERIGSLHLRTVFEHSEEQPEMLELRGEVTVEISPDGNHAFPSEVARFSVGAERIQETADD